MCDNNMDVGKRMRIDDWECSMFESPPKRSRPSPFQISQAVPKRFLKAYTQVPDEEMDTGRLRLKMQKIHRVNLIRLNLLKSREIIERH